MPFDFDRIIDHQLYLATQQCIQPHVQQQQRRVSSAPAATTTAAAAAAAGGPPRIAGARKSSLGSLISPWTTSSGGSNSSSGGGRKYSNLYHHHRPRPSAQQGYSPVDLFFTAPVGVPARGGRELYGRGGGGRTPAQPSREGSSSSLDQFVTAPVGDFTTSPVVDVPLPPQQRHGNGSRPGSSDTDDWTFETASAGSASGSCSGLETTVDLTPSPPPSRQQQPGKFATYTSAAAASQSHAPEPPPLPSQQHGNGVVAAVTLQVQDLQRARRFYERVFGVPCLCSPEEDGTSAVLSLNGGALVVTLHESLPPDTRRGDDVAAPRVVPLTVPVDDVGEVCRRLRCLAGEGERVGGPWYAEPVAGHGPARVVEFCDPSGNLWRVGKGIEGL